ncbi:YbaN family protein [Neoaquamicrobium sediminum]|uniref:YbaN family protein n=2 Tax=Neoaquamicrobium sediminum TaxID=1849104 RepID=UPI0028A94A8C|nr:YbaN family protein [Mesorhizobium sediminum]
MAIFNRTAVIRWRFESMRVVWSAVGYSSVAVGVAGTVLPFLPATPFFILAAYAFSRGSPKVESWLLEHPRWGPVIRDWRRGRAISKKAKTASMSVICATPVLSWVLGFEPIVLGIQVVVLTMVAAFIATRPSPGPDAQP